MEPFWPETQQFGRVHEHDELQQSLAHDKWNACCRWPHAARASVRATRHALEPQPERADRAECAELESIVSTGDMSTRAALAASKGISIAAVNQSIAVSGAVVITHPIILKNHFGHFYLDNLDPFHHLFLHVGSRWRQETQPFNALDMHEVTTAVESLYTDELKPYGRILRKRLAEKAATMGYANLDVDIKRPMAIMSQQIPFPQLILH